jgi:formylglycine-generating enzyme required for sulfatase activity/tRNA A-37 threonylcarbamoyl transferase component Bud32
MAWTQGHTLRQQQYVIEAVLGQGGFGITYRAWDVGLGRRVVIKTPNENEYLKRHPEYDKYVDRFIKEGRMLARFSQDPHPNIVQVIELFQEGDVHCLVMNYIEGETLFEIVKRRGSPIPEAEIVPCICQIGDALSVVHQIGLVHRDAHPGNIMLRSKDQRAVLIDFGIAKELVPATLSSAGEVGNKGFAPYEQITMGSRDLNVDVYCLAATLYYAVTGHYPASSLGRKLHNVRLIPPKERIIAISDRLNQAILEGMALEAGDRPQTMGEWLRLVESPVVSVSVKPVKERSQSVPKPVKPPLVKESPDSTTERRSRRQILQWLGFGSGGLVLAVIAGQRTWNQPSPPQRPQPLSVSSSITDLKPFNFEVVTVNAKGEEAPRQPKEAKAFVEDLGNGITLEMISIPGGSFQMGSPESEKSRGDNESPQHKVTVPAFLMGRYAVTQAQYESIMNKNPANFKGANRPVETVSWNDAQEFCKKLSQKTGRTYRLPSEAEWEYACRAGTTTPFHFGETITSDLANYDGTVLYQSEPKGEYRKQTTEVGIFPPNAFGLSDMHGNVWEWCEDIYHEKYDGAPTDGSAWNVGGEGTRSLRRGGSWFLDPRDCRSANRVSFGLLGQDIGLRVVAVLG